MIKKIEKHRRQKNIAILVLVMLIGQACVQVTETQVDVPQSNPMLSETPTWTPSPEMPTMLPTATKTPISNTPTASPATAMQSSEKVIFKVSGGNLNVRRGPDLAYNYVGVLYEGDVAVAIGRDRVGDWLQVELPSDSNITGWVTTETKYSTVDGDIKSLPLVKVEPALPAFIRNCTKHKVLIDPAGVELLSKYNALENESHFDVLTYAVYDLDVAGTPRLADVSLAEGKRVDIIYDGNGDKSKCE
jgi:hypothetical protein